MMAKMIREATKVTSCLWCPYNKCTYGGHTDRYCEKFSLNIYDEDIIHPECKLEDWDQELDTPQEEKDDKEAR